ncbi:MAG: hypothetical protein BJ554DRAFT_4731, partial [Olpidium bornovanus]
DISESNVVWDWVGTTRRNSNTTGNPYFQRHTLVNRFKLRAQASKTTEISASSSPRGQGRRRKSQALFANLHPRWCGACPS